jgi:hypothetical protein
MDRVIDVWDDELVTILETVGRFKLLPLKVATALH